LKVAVVAVAVVVDEAAETHGSRLEQTSRVNSLDSVEVLRARCRARLDVVLTWCRELTELLDVMLTWCRELSELLDVVRTWCRDLSELLDVVLT
jgi:hypothetical protein